MVDIWTMGELLVEVMRPERDMPLDRPGAFLGPYPSGAPGIFIDAAARLGHSAAIISAVGDDAFGRLLRRRLADDGVSTDLVRVVPGRSTGVAFVAYADDGSREFIFHWAGTPAVMAQVPPAEVAVGARAFHVMGCSMMADEAFAGRIAETAALFSAAGALVSLDPNIRPELAGGRSIEAIVAPVLERCSVLLPGAGELRLLAGTNDLDAAADAILGRTPIEVVAVKLGREGCRVYTPGARVDVPAFEVREVDPTGAGDCFDAAFVVALLDGASPGEAGLFAAAEGALAAAAFGPMEGAADRPSLEALLRARG